MIDNRTKVDALKDLGEKITGATIDVKENETIVGVIDKIASNYSGGGSVSEDGDIILKTAIDPTQTQIAITDSQDIAVLNSWVVRIGEKSTDIPKNVIVSANQSGTIGANIFKIGLVMVNGSMGYFAGGVTTLSFIDGNPQTITKSILLTNEGQQNNWVMLLA